MPSLGIFSTNPIGEEQNKPLKIDVASATVKGPYIQPANTSL